MPRGSDRRTPPEEIHITAPRHRCVDYSECYHLSYKDVRLLLEVAKGLSHKEIGARLGVTESTIKCRVLRLRSTLRVSHGTSPVDLVVRAHQLRIITIPQQKHPPPVIVTGGPEM